MSFGKPRPESTPLGFRLFLSCRDKSTTSESRIRDRNWLMRTSGCVSAILKKIQEEERHAAPEEQKALVKYVGWGASEFANNMFADSRGDPAKLLTDEELRGAQQSTLNAHYTSEPVVRSMYKAPEQFGFKGRVLTSVICLCISIARANILKR